MTLRHIAIIFAAFALLAPEPLFADVYKCMVNGQIKFSDRACATNAEKIHVTPPQRDPAINVISPSSSTYDQSDPLSPNLPSLEFKIIPIQLSNEEIEIWVKKAKSHIVHNLKDPDSANFRELKLFQVEHSGGTDTFVCGEVNAKNSYGGYVGFKNFVVYNNRMNTVSGGIEEGGRISSTIVNDKWWKYEADDLCITKGIPVQ